MFFLHALHNLVADAVLLYLVLVGLWGMAGWARGLSVTRGYAGALVVGQVVLMGQAVSGILIVVLGGVRLDWMHLLYGVAAVLALPLAYMYLSGRKDRPALLFYSLATLFVFGLALRAMTTAS